MQMISLPNNETLPAFGLGTWRMGENASTRKTEITAVRKAFEIGYRLIDTAEMYGEGGAEEIVGHALADSIAAKILCREDAFIVGKGLPTYGGAALTS